MSVAEKTHVRSSLAYFPLSTHARECGERPKAFGSRASVISNFRWIYRERLCPHSPRDFLGIGPHCQSSNPSLHLRHPSPSPSLKLTVARARVRGAVLKKRTWPMRPAMLRK
jgi:hypothetical protein